MLSLTGSSAAVALLAACGGDDGGATAPTDETATAAATAAPAASPTAGPISTVAGSVPDPKIEVRGEAISPTDTDAAIASSAAQSHFVALAPSVKQRGQLFMYLPGSGTSPTTHKLINEQAARNGFHVVSLFYQSLSPAGQNLLVLCGNDSSGECFNATELRILDGQSRTGSQIEVTEVNSVMNRLVKLLRYLPGKHPGEGWDSYLVGDTPKWESIVVAGASLGGSLVAQIARERSVARVVMLSAPLDHTPIGRQNGGAFQVAPWLSGPHATPSARYYAFGHSADENVDWELQWKAAQLGLLDLGAITNVDGAKAPFGNSHLLVTSAKPATTGANANHISIVYDAVTPKDANGQPLHAPVWQYLMVG
ncbi:MAG: hypothetical protein IPH65_04440 [Dehalococcoidia bacterium]|uniref:BPSS1187 family protein n=1 Tax=Candidatus Amarobacter glycogenicus TaxID=3140699 RepID=UPI0031373D72|nr:hypothetical protein [Dehalococcoidia bacterium]